MSATTSRLLDLWLPPEGAGRALGCLATTFTFEADFFEQQCLARFLGLDTRPGEAATDIGYLIEREEKLAEVPVCVVADRSLNPDSRSLRWDVLPVAAPTGVMHAKASVLVWEQAVRLIVASANLSEHAFRRSIELAVGFDAQPEAELWQGVFDDLLEAIERVVRLGPDAPGNLGPKARALEILNQARERIADFLPPERPRRGMPKIAVVDPGRGTDALDGLMSVWRGGPPRWATVMSPYFDVAEGPSRAARRLTEILAKREASVDFIVPVEHLSDAEIAQVPGALIDALPSRIESNVWDVKQPDQSEPRKLHGKLVLLESDRWTAALVGSSNFSAPGLGLGGGGNVEIGVAMGASRSSEASGALLALALVGEHVDPEDDTVRLEPVEDPEEKVPAVPRGFVQVLGEPGPPAELEIELDAEGLPSDWWIRTPDGLEILDSRLWAQSREALTKIAAPAGELPFNLTIEWQTASDELARTNLPVNVTDPGRLQPPAELRALPVDALLRALASVRPLHEAVVEATARQERLRSRQLDDLDPLNRFSPTGQLLHRTRELSAALAGLRDRLERPAATVDAFRWRLEGPFGPMAIADKLVEERQVNRGVEGEEAFLVAEIALTLASVDLHHTSRFIPEELREMKTALQAAIQALGARVKQLDHAPGLDSYVREALARATP